MKKLIITVVCLSLFFVSCGKAQSEKTTEHTTQLVTTEEITEAVSEEDIIASGQNVTIETPVAVATNTDSVKVLPENIEPLNDHAPFDPRYTNTNIVNPEYFNKNDLAFYVPLYMNENKITYEEIRELRFNEKTSESSYIVTIITDQGNEEVIINRVGDKYYITPNIDAGSAEMSDDTTDNINEEE